MKAIGKIGAVFFFGLLITGIAFAQFDNSPSNLVIIPEAIWSAAGGGGTWVTYVQVTTFAPDTDVNVYFVYNGGERGPINIASGIGQWNTRAWTNILQSLQSLEGGAFNYYNRVGALEFRTQDASKTIHVQARTINGNYGKTMQGLKNTDSNTLRYDDTPANIRRGVIQNLENNATYRTFVGFYNFSVTSVTVQFTVIRYNTTAAGTVFSKVIPAFGYISFNPFDEAGVPYPANNFSNCWLYINPTSGSGRVFGFGSSANNNTNDTYAHTMVQFQ